MTRRNPDLEKITHTWHFFPFAASFTYFIIYSHIVPSKSVGVGLVFHRKAVREAGVRGRGASHPAPGGAGSSSMGGAAASDSGGACDALGGISAWRPSQPPGPAQSHHHPHQSMSSRPPERTPKAPI